MNEAAVDPPALPFLDRLANVAEGLRTRLDSDPATGAIECLVILLILHVLLQIADLYVRMKAGLLPRARRPSSRDSAASGDRLERSSGTASTATERQAGDPQGGRAFESDAVDPQGKRTGPEPRPDAETTILPPPVMPDCVMPRAIPFALSRAIAGAPLRVQPAAQNSKMTSFASPLA